MNDLDLAAPSDLPNPAPIDPFRVGRQLVGSVGRVVCYFDESETVVASLTSGETVRGKAPKDAFLQWGLSYKFLGRWDNHHKHGQQFCFDTYALVEPVGRQGVFTYLTKFASGVGAAKARQLWDAYGASAVSVLRTDPGRVARDGHLSQAVADEAAKDLAVLEYHESTKLELYDVFSSRGFPAEKLISACIMKWGAAAAARVRMHPFDLLQHGLPGCGFERVDKLYTDLGFPPDRMVRQIMCGWSSLHKDREGNTWHLRHSIEEDIGRRVSGANVRPKDAVKYACRGRGKLDPRMMVCERGDFEWVSEYRRGRNEAIVARQLVELMSGPSLWPDLSGAGNITPHQKEKISAATAGPVGVFTGGPGTGKTHTLGALVREIVARYGLFSVTVVAPTGKAAVRATEALRKNDVPLEAMTIHRRLGVCAAGDGGWTFRHNEKNPLPYQFLVVDEPSMVGTDLLAALLRACAVPVKFGERPAVTYMHRYKTAPRCRRCKRLLEDAESMARGFGPECAKKVNPSEFSPVGVDVTEEATIPGYEGAKLPGTHVLFVGDPGQLPPVEHGAPLRDMIASGVIPVGELTEIHRNGGQIVRACADVRAGRTFDVCDRYDQEAGKNLLHFQAQDANESVEVLASILERFRQSGRFDPVWDVQILVPLNKRSPVSRKALNEQLQGFLNPLGKRVAGNKYRVGDKVICLKNGWFKPLDADPDDRDTKVFVANGDIGRVTEVEPRRMWVEFLCPSRKVMIPLGGPKDDEEDDDAEGGGGGGASIDLAYAITCHKFQGSECPCVIVMADQGATFSVASREWWYTAMSRAAKLCIIIGLLSVVERQCQRKVLGVRKTFLKELIQEGTL